MDHLELEDQLAGPGDQRELKVTVDHLELEDQLAGPGDQRELKVTVDHLELEDQLAGPGDQRELKVNLVILTIGDFQDHLDQKEPKVTVGIMDQKEPILAHLPAPS